MSADLAEAFRAHGLETHLYQRSARPVPPFGEAVGDRVIDALRDNGIERVVAEDGNLDVDE